MTVVVKKNANNISHVIGHTHIHHLIYCGHVVSTGPVRHLVSLSPPPTSSTHTHTHARTHTRLHCFIDCVILLILVFYKFSNNLDKCLLAGCIDLLMSTFGNKHLLAEHDSPLWLSVHDLW